MSQSVTGPLRNWTPTEWRKNAHFFNAYGRTVTGPQLRQAFLIEEMKGHDCIPLASYDVNSPVVDARHCNNFCYKNGCRGHSEELHVERVEKDRPWERLTAVLESMPLPKHLTDPVKKN